SPGGDGDKVVSVDYMGNIGRNAAEVSEGAEVGIISYGSNDPAIVEARSRLAQAGLRTSYLRLRALPLTEAVRDFVNGHLEVVVVEMNSDAQMCQLLRLHVPERAADIVPVNHSDGLPLTARWVTEHVMAAVKAAQPKES
ncbi:MAG: hypothetical protein ACHQIO_23780, partial [Nevskiales bacterium]